GVCHVRTYRLPYSFSFLHRFCRHKYPFSDIPCILSRLGKCGSAADQCAEQGDCASTEPCGTGGRARPLLSSSTDIFPLTASHSPRGPRGRRPSDDARGHADFENGNLLEA